ncbi:glucoamylase family protein [Pontibacter sp. SGAir0037]|uniref:glucoamylase family protein n=1 Tax=Pontibacter sp. SGAir0037 TaxID=2571030 RepID=UPI0010CCF99B|nr:glucoamylase family protein [Pontibacter sp. SGAir0037]QCR22249.1 beta-glucosidase [Pontibacter sp. SGAir0037]
MINKIIIGLVFLSGMLCSCNKENDTPGPAASFNYTGISVNGKSNNSFTYDYISLSPAIKFSFAEPVSQASIATSISMKTQAGTALEYNSTLENGNKTVVIQPKTPLAPLSKFSVNVSNELLSEAQGKLRSAISLTLSTGIDSTNKFPVISDEELLTLVQRQTFKYFWDFAHPVSGLARERNTSGDVVTTGGSGFGAMAIVTGVHRNFISRSEGLAQMQKIVGFLKNRAERFHGAYPHWLNGSTGAAIAFSSKDNGADLVETSFLMQGLLTARQFFNGTDPAEAALRADINTLWREVEWSFFRKSNEQVLYWHWSPDYQWEMNMPVKGWNEALVTYVLAAASPTHAIPKSVYDAGWAMSGGMRNGNTYQGITLPLGPANGGPLFFSHYSFLGINPNGLADAYAQYKTQNQAHSLINYNYCKANPKGFYGYSASCWGLTASDDINGYMAHEPNNDNSVISPTAALSSFPYTPAESMAALKFFYYKLGDRIWKEYGFVDAFSLHHNWFADSFLAIDQGPIIIMIENYRSGLLWDLFMSCPEVKTGMRELGFQSPNL